MHSVRGTAPAAIPSNRGSSSSFLLRHRLFAAFHLVYLFFLQNGRVTQGRKEKKEDKTGLQAARQTEFRKVENGWNRMLLFHRRRLPYPSTRVLGSAAGPILLIEVVAHWKVPDESLSRRAHLTSSAYLASSAPTSSTLRHATT